MTTYLLTTGDDKITGTDGADTFDETVNGEIGGADNLSGAGGNDTFFLLDGESDFVDGGSGVDTVVISTTLFGLKTNDVETLDLRLSNPTLWIAAGELAKFSNILTSSYSNKIDIRLSEAGSNLDFAGKIKGGLFLEINGSGLSSGLTVKGGDSGNRINGTRFDDILRGGEGNDYLYGGPGFDKLYGYGGDDRVSVGSGTGTVNIIDGGDGIDTLYASNCDISKFEFSSIEILDIADASVSLRVLENVGTVIGASEINLLLVGPGGVFDFSKLVSSKSSVYVTAGGIISATTIIGTEGNDYLQGSGLADVLEGGAGQDTLIGLTGIDTASYSRSKSGVTIGVNFMEFDDSAGDAKGDRLDYIENLIGSAYGDRLYGDDGVNSLQGGGGSDTLEGKGGSDKLFGEDGNDMLLGGAGADYLSGGVGTDTVSYSGAGGVAASLAAPAINTGEAKGDTYNSIENLTGTNSGDWLTGNAGVNAIVGDNGRDTIEGLAGDDKLFGGDGSDTLIGGAGADYLSGGTGIDTASYAQATAAVKVNLADPSLNAGEARGDTFNSIENLTGSAFNDTLDGNAGANTLTGLGGIDVLRGAAGNDTMQGGDDDDKLGGGDGNDLLSGGAGADYLNGGLGADTASYAGAAAGVIVSLAVPAGNTGEAAGDTIISIENLEGSGFGDRLTGNSAANAISGLNGTDVIDGGAGSDALTGGAGKDYFVFTSALGAANVDTISDFSATDDTIRLDNAVFAALGANGALLSGYLRANTTGLAQDSNDHIVYETDTGKLFYDADGNGAGAAIQFCVVSGNPILTAADFIVV